MDELDEDLEFVVHNKALIERSTEQALESLYLMANSKNIDTIIGRYELLEERLPPVRKANKTRVGFLAIADVIAKFEDKHGVDEIENSHASVLLNADKEQREVFFVKTLFIGFDKHYDEQMMEISELKMEHAIEKRFEKLEKKFDRVDSIIKSHQHLKDIDQMMSKISSDYKKMEIAFERSK